MRVWRGAKGDQHNEKLFAAFLSINFLVDKFPDFQAMAAEIFRRSATLLLLLAILHAATAQNATLTQLTWNNSDANVAASSFRNFDAMYYINLPYRVDRRAEMEKELKKWGWLERTERVEGVVAWFSLASSLRRPFSSLPLHPPTGIHTPENGGLGCTKAHIKIVKMFLANPSLRHALIMEDDLMFLGDPRSKIGWFLHEYGDKGWDALMLAANLLATTPYTQELTRIRRAYTTAAYAITRATAEKLLPIFERSEQLLTAEKRYGYSLDALWEIEQSANRWYTFEPKAAIQRTSYSDVEKFIATYSV